MCARGICLRALGAEGAGAAMHVHCYCCAGQDTARAQTKGTQRNTHNSIGRRRPAAAGLLVAATEEITLHSCLWERSCRQPSHSMLGTWQTLKINLETNFVAVVVCVEAEKTSVTADGAAEQRCQRSWSRSTQTCGHHSSTKQRFSCWITLNTAAFELARFKSVRGIRTLRPCGVRSAV